MKCNKYLAGMCAVLLFSLPAQAGIFSKLYDFAGGSSSGSLPQNTNLQLYGGRLYGVTNKGGENNLGVLYSIGTEGGSGSFSILHPFAGGNDDGQLPYGNVRIYGDTLYGMTWEGGAEEYGYGVIFKQQMGGSYSVLYKFDGVGGSNPYGGVKVSGGSIYGMTNNNGENYSGTVFSVGTNGAPSSFSVLHSFAAFPGDGQYPVADLLVQGSAIYGMTPALGGTIFRIDGGGYTVLRTLSGSDGVYPNGSLILSDGRLYGMTSGGGEVETNTIFSIGTEGGDTFSVLHTFVGGANDGMAPSGDLTISGGTLYGMTYGGGNGAGEGYGVIFSIGTEGGESFTLLHKFTSGEGTNPLGTLLMSGTVLYGVTIANGANTGGSGTIFSYDTVPEPSVISFLSLGLLGLIAWRITRKRN